MRVSARVSENERASKREIFRRGGGDRESERAREGLRVREGVREREDLMTLEWL